MIEITIPEVDGSICLENKEYIESDSPRSEWRITDEQLQNFIKQRMEKPTDRK